MGMNSINDLEYFNSLDNSDTDDNFEQFEPVLSRAEEALIKAKKSELTRSDRRANFHMNRERPEENKFTVQRTVNMGYCVINQRKEILGH